MNSELLSFNNIHHLVLVILLLLFSTQFLVSHCSCHDHERAALLTFKSFLTDPSNRLSSWKEGENCCKWYGVECSQDSFHIVSLDLRNTALNGTISPSIFNLTHLQHLDLSLNDFQFSKIPHQFGNLKDLTYLNISGSMFSGSITTQFANLSSLQYLDISSSVLFPSRYNRYYYDTFSGISSNDVSWLRGLVNLKVQSLAGVNISMATSTAMDWAKPISYLSHIRQLDLSYCGISSPIPVNEFLNLSRLSSLKMGGNNFLNSSIPLQFANLTSLSVLDLTGCELQGSISYLPHQLKEIYLESNSNLIVNLTWMFDHHEWRNLQTLSISGTKVNGPIPSSISNTSSLVSLRASDCLIQGSLPNSISNLSQLQYLDLSMNFGLTGYLHSLISNLRNLEHLDFRYNKLQGSIPESICQNSFLQVIWLFNNNLTGTIPSCISKLRNLQYFDVSDNSIGGTVSLIPLINKLNMLTVLDLSSNRITVEIDRQSLTSKPQLVDLSLKNCNLRGYIPDFICDLTELRYLYLSHNSITGVNLTCIFKLPKLFYLDLSSNNLQGKLPRSLHLANSLGMINLANNSLGGEISTKMGERISKIAYVSLSSNNLSGSIPFSICSKDLTEPLLQHLDLYNNKLSGEIPSSLGHCIYFTSLNLGRNNLIGTIPNELGRAINLKYLQFSNNFLNGTFPSFIQRLKELEVLILGNNNFEGGVPTFIGSLLNLTIFSLRSNKFNGSIPKEITSLHRLQILDLSNNTLSGPIPKNIGELGTLTIRSRTDEVLRLDNHGRFWRYISVQLEMVTKGAMREFVFESDYKSGIDLSCNNLDGSIPEEMVQLKGLSMLNLSQNHLAGKIPMNIGNMNGLESLDLSSNRIFGGIPQSLTSINYLQILNLSYNNLSGMIPREDHFDTLSVDGSAYIGNDLLCGFPTNISCYPNNSPDTSMQRDDEDDPEDARQKLLFYGVVFLGFGVGFWGLFLVLLLKKEKWWFGYWRAVDKIAVRMVGCFSKH